MRELLTTTWWDSPLTKEAEAKMVAAITVNSNMMEIMFGGGKGFVFKYEASP